MVELDIVGPEIAQHNNELAKHIDVTIENLYDRQFQSDSGIIFSTRGIRMLMVEWRVVIRHLRLNPRTGCQTKV